MGLEQWGASEQYYKIASGYPEYELGRVISQEKDLFRVVMDKEECLARVSGKFRYNVMETSGLTGDGLQQIKSYLQKTKIDREQANELEYVDESQKSDAADSANASNGSTGGKPVRNPEREKPKWEDTITNRMLHWSYTPEQKEEVKKALAAGVPKATILTYFYPEVIVEKMSSYRNKH